MTAKVKIMRGMFIRRKTRACVPGCQGGRESLNPRAAGVVWEVTGAGVDCELGQAEGRKPRIEEDDRRWCLRR